ncbi:MAG TPA: alpha/beta hydrolase [Clostridiales bacterium]|nr:alpha/beta hydrolase [Clostridiales bacterium]
MEMIIDDYKINYKITGEGKTVVILQGWGTSMDMYDAVANSINSRYRVIQLDFPGFGNSDEPREAWDVDDYGDFVLKFIDELDIKEASFIGHSYGGRVIIKLASRDKKPVIIEKIVLIDSAGILPKKSLKQKTKIRIYKIGKKLANTRILQMLFPEAIDNWKSKQGSADYRNASPIMRQCLVKAVNEDLTDYLKRIMVDTLLVWGDQDTATPISDAHIMEKEIPKAGLVVLKGAGHFSFIDQPHIFDKVMKSYFGIS